VIRCLADLLHDTRIFSFPFAERWRPGRYRERYERKSRPWFGTRRCRSSCTNRCVPDVMQLKPGSHVFVKKTRDHWHREVEEVVYGQHGLYEIVLAKSEVLGRSADDERIALPLDAEAVQRGCEQLLALLRLPGSGERQASGGTARASVGTLMRPVMRSFNRVLNRSWRVARLRSR